MEEVNAISHQLTIFLVELFNTLEHVFNRTLMLTTTILGTLVVKQGESKITSTDQFKYKIEMSLYNSQWLLRFFKTA